jgi:hypothetical protein
VIRVADIIEASDLLIRHAIPLADAGQGFSGPDLMIQTAPAGQDAAA